MNEAPEGYFAMIGNYYVGKTIGKGTFGKVKMGLHIYTLQNVAIKILDKEKIVDGSDKLRVSREIQILRRIRHPNIIQLFEGCQRLKEGILQPQLSQIVPYIIQQIIESQTQLFLITEYAPNNELFNFIVKRNRLNEKQSAEFLLQILNAVEYLHQNNIVHRDLKPENLLLDHNNCIKAADFGLSNTYEDGETLKTACGSPCYAAPEMVSGKRYMGLRTDIWSCGIILFAMVCGYLPFEDSSTPELYKKIINDPLKMPSFLSERTMNLLSRILEKDPEKRLTIEGIRRHEFCTANSNQPILKGIIFGKDEILVDPLILSTIQKSYGIDTEEAKSMIQTNKHNQITATYYLLLNSHIRKGGVSVADLSRPPSLKNKTASQSIISHQKQQGIIPESLTKKSESNKPNLQDFEIKGNDSNKLKNKEPTGSPPSPKNIQPGPIRVSQTSEKEPNSLIKIQNHMVEASKQIEVLPQKDQQEQVELKAECGGSTCSGDMSTERLGQRNIKGRSINSHRLKESDETPSSKEDTISSKITREQMNQIGRQQPGQPRVQRRSCKDGHNKLLTQSVIIDGSPLCEDNPSTQVNSGPKGVLQNKNHRPNLSQDIKLNMPDSGQMNEIANAGRRVVFNEMRSPSGRNFANLIQKISKGYQPTQDPSKLTDSFQNIPAQEINSISPQKKSMAPEDSKHYTDAQSNKRKKESQMDLNGSQFQTEQCNRQSFFSSIQSQQDTNIIQAQQKQSLEQNTIENRSGQNIIVKIHHKTKSESVNIQKVISVQSNNTHEENENTSPIIKGKQTQLPMNEGHKRIYNENIAPIQEKINPFFKQTQQKTNGVTSSLRDSTSTLKYPQQANFFANSSLIFTNNSNHDGSNTMNTSMPLLKTYSLNSQPENSITSGNIASNAKQVSKQISTEQQQYLFNIYYLQSFFSSLENQIILQDKNQSRQDNESNELEFRMRKSVTPELSHINASLPLVSIAQNIQQRQGNSNTQPSKETNSNIVSHPKQIQQKYQTKTPTSRRLVPPNRPISSHGQDAFVKNQTIKSMVSIINKGSSENNSSKIDISTKDVSNSQVHIKKTSQISSKEIKEPKVRMIGDSPLFRKDQQNVNGSKYYLGLKKQMIQKEPLICNYILNTEQSIFNQATSSIPNNDAGDEVIRRQNQQKPQMSYQQNGYGHYVGNKSLNINNLNTSSRQSNHMNEVSSAQNTLQIENNSKTDSLKQKISQHVLPFSYSLLNVQKYKIRKNNLNCTLTSSQAVNTHNTLTSHPMKDKH